MSNFTGRLGSSDSQPGNIELGSSGATGTTVNVTADDSLSSITESVARGSGTFTRTLADSLATLTEAVTRAASFVRTASDVISAISEAVVQTRRLARSAADSISAITESAVRGALNKVRTAADSIATLTEAVTRPATTFHRTASTSVTPISESVLAGASLLSGQGVRYMDGFNTYTNLAERYYDTANASIQANQGRVATQQAMRLTSGGTAYVRRELTQFPMTSFVMGVAFRMNNLVNIWPMYAMEYPSTLHIGVELDGSGHLLVRRGNTTTLATGTTVLTTGTYYWIELKATISDTGSYELWLNGTLEVSGTGDTRNGGTGVMTAAQIGVTSGAASGTFDFCDFYVSDSTEVRGDSKVIRLLPAADGTFRQWTPVGPGGTDGTNLVRFPTSGTPTYSGSGTPSLAADGNTTTVAGWGPNGDFWQVTFSVPQVISRIKVISSFGGNLGVVNLTTNTGINLNSGTIGIAATYEWDFYPFTVSWIKLTLVSGRVGTGNLAEAEAYLADGTHYSNVNQVPTDEDTTYNEARSIALRDTFTMETLNFALGIGAIQVGMRAKRVYAGSHHLEADSGTEQVLLPPPNSYGTLLAVSEENPSTGSAWKQTEINAGEFGYRIVD